MKYLEKLKRLAGKKKVAEWSEMVVMEENESLVRNLVNDYYDKCYRIPRGEALQVYHVPDGLITNQEKLLQSSLVMEISELGIIYLSGRECDHKS